MSGDERIAALVARLSRDWETIDLAEAAGNDATDLVDFWLDPLREYERLVDAQRLGQDATGVRKEAWRAHQTP